MLDLLVQTDPSEALKAARAWHAHADGDRALEASALSAMGRALFELGEVEHAVAAFRRAVDAADETNDLDLVFSISMSASAALAEAGAVDEALNRIDPIGPRRPPSQRGRLLTQRGYILHHASRLGEALGQLDVAESELRNSGDELGWLRLLVNRGLIRLQQGAFDLAEADLLEADRVAEQLGQSAM